MKRGLRIVSALALIMVMGTTNTFAASSPMDAKDQFVEGKIALAEEKLSEIEVSNEDIVDGKHEEFIDLGDGCYAKVKLEDVAEGNSLAKLEASTMASTPASTTLWKDYGDRKFTATCEISILSNSYKMSVCNHYTLSSTGIKVRYGERNMYADGVATSVAGNVIVECSNAVVGQTVSMNCKFMLNTLGKTYKLTNNVKCVEIDKVGQRVKVIQSWSGSWG